MENIKELKNILNRKLIQYNRIISLRRYSKEYEKINQSLASTSKDKVKKAIELLDVIASDHHSKVETEQQRKIQKELEKQERKRQYEIYLQNEKDNTIVANKSKSKQGYENYTFSTELNRSIIGPPQYRKLENVTNTLNIIDNDKLEKIFTEFKEKTGANDDTKIAVAYLAQNGKTYALKDSDGTYKYMTLQESKNIMKKMNDDASSGLGEMSFVVNVSAVSISRR